MWIQGIPSIGRRGLLGFTFGAKDADMHKEVICDEMPVEGEEEGTLHRVLLARPDTTSPGEWTQGNNQQN